MTRSLVLLHGFTGAPASWDEVREALKVGGAPPRILAPAAIGHDGTPGRRSTPPSSDPGAPALPDTFEAEVDRLAALVEREGLQGAHLAGYSMGGRLALGLLVRHPSLFSGATLIGASPGLPHPPPGHTGHAEAMEERRRRAEWDEEWARLLESEGLSTFVAAWEALPMFASQGRLPAGRRAAQDRIRRGHDPLGLARSLRTIGLSRMPDYRPRLAGIPVPVRLVVGARDARFRALAEEMARRMPRAEIVVVEDAGHNVILERPAEAARLIREGMERA